MKKFQRIRISLTFIVVLSTHLHLKAVLVNSHLIHTSLMSLVTNLTAVECDPQYSHRENKKPSLPQSVISLWFNSQQTSTESSNSTSRTRLIHWDNLAKQNSFGLWDPGLFLGATPGQTMMWRVDTIAWTKRQEKDSYHSMSWFHSYMRKPNKLASRSIS